MLKMTPAQCRAARALLGITQPQLANEAGLGLSTIVDFEKIRRPVSDDAIRAIQSAFDKRDIEFIDENGGGAGVRLRRPSQHPKRR